MSEPPRKFQPSLMERAAVKSFELLNRFVPWYKLPGFLGAFNLASLRISLRTYNLHDGYADPSAQGSFGEALEDGRFRDARNSDGKYNSLERPLMGCAGMRFGRNFPRESCPKPTEEALWTPNPRAISEKLMVRKSFIPATTLNLLAAAWIQFQTHDWFNHEQASFHAAAMQDLCRPASAWDAPSTDVRGRTKRCTMSRCPRAMRGRAGRCGCQRRSRTRRCTRPT